MPASRRNTSSATWGGVVSHDEQVLTFSAGSPVERPRVFVGMPYYGDVDPAAAQAYVAPNTHRVDPELAVDVVGWLRCSTSITPRTFNELLGQAMDLRDEGRVTHFAMIHSDVAPLVSGWVNRLWAEMLFQRADVVSAVVPLKIPGDETGRRTSTAVGPENDPWAAPRYVTVEDRGKLPRTFAAADVCGPGEVLLVNTGLWLADLRGPWWDDFAFEFQTRIVRGPDGKRRAESVPEDWAMSRHLHRRGAKVCATWAVPLEHAGGFRYRNF